jgi:hypothetical protein
LTVINFSCFTIRGVAAIERAPAILTELERVERAVATVTELLANLPEEVEAASANSPPGPVRAGKVYPLFKSRQPKR